MENANVRDELVRSRLAAAKKTCTDFARSMRNAATLAELNEIWNEFGQFHFNLRHGMYRGELFPRDVEKKLGIVETIFRFRLRKLEKKEKPWVAFRPKGYPNGSFFASQRQADRAKYGPKYKRNKERRAQLYHRLKERREQEIRMREMRKRHK